MRLEICIYKDKKSAKNQIKMGRLILEPSEKAIRVICSQSRKFIVPLQNEWSKDSLVLELSGSVNQVVATNQFLL